jgi:hypothetical protein
MSVTTQEAATLYDAMECSISLNMGGLGARNFPNFPKYAAIRKIQDALDAAEARGRNEILDPLMESIRSLSRLSDDALLKASCDMKEELLRVAKQLKNTETGRHDT